MAKRKRNRTRKIKPFTILQKTYMIAGVFVLAGMITVYGSAMIVLKGPSVTVSNLLTSTMMETRTLKSIARLFFSEEEMETIMNRNSVSDTDEITDSETDFVIDESKKDKIEIIADLNAGSGLGQAWGCDLTYKYVEINALYTS